MSDLMSFAARNWILIVLVGNFFIALSVIFSKIVLAGSVAKPIKATPYTFFTALGGVLFFGFGLISQPWLGLMTFGLPHIILGLAAGAVLIFGLWVLYFVIERNEASRVSTIIVGAVPFFTFLLKYIFLGEIFNLKQFLALVFLVVGGVLASAKHWHHANYSKKDLWLTVLSGFSFAFGLILVEQTFRFGNFISGMAWISGGYVFASLVILVSAGWQSIFAASKDAEKKSIALFLAEKVCGVSGSVVLKFAISLVSVTFVNAFEGARQFFVLILAGLLSLKYPGALKEELRGVVLWEKILAAALVGFGIFLLVFGN